MTSHIEDGKDAIGAGSGSADDEQPQEITIVMPWGDLFTDRLRSAGYLTPNGTYDVTDGGIDAAPGLMWQMTVNARSLVVAQLKKVQPYWVQPYYTTRNLKFGDANISYFEEVADKPLVYVTPAKKALIQVFFLSFGYYNQGKDTITVAPMPGGYWKYDVPAGTNVFVVLYATINNGARTLGRYSNRAAIKKGGVKPIVFSLVGSG